MRYGGDQAPGDVARSFDISDLLPPAMGVTGKGFVRTAPRLGALEETSVPRASLRSPEASATSEPGSVA